MVNSSPWFPSFGGAQDQVSIYRTQVHQFYLKCKELKQPTLWIYLWNQWLCPGEYSRISFNRHPQIGIPITRTTSVAESHFAFLKQHLNQQGKRDLSKVVESLLSDFFPIMQNILLRPSLKIEKDHWVNDREMKWKSLFAAAQSHEPDFALTDVSNWTCSCSDYLTLNKSYRWCQHLIRATGIKDIGPYTYNWFNDPPFFRFEQPLEDGFICRFSPLSQASESLDVSIYSCFPNEESNSKSFENILRTEKLLYDAEDFTQESGSSVNANEEHYLMVEDFLKRMREEQKLAEFEASSAQEAVDIAREALIEKESALQYASLIKEARNALVNDIIEFSYDAGYIADLKKYGANNKLLLHWYKDLRQIFQIDRLNKGETVPIPATWHRRSAFRRS